MADSLLVELSDFLKIDALTSLFQHMKPISEHVNIHFDSDRMYIQTMDNSRISILEVTIPSSWFTKYECPKAFMLGLSSSILYKILNSRDKAQAIAMKYDENADIFCMDMSSEHKSVFDKHFEVPLVDLETEVMEIPEMEYQAEMGMPSLTFSVLISQLKAFGDTLDICCNENKIELVSKSTENGKMSVVVSIDDLSSFSIEEECELNMSFSMTHLHMICANSKLSKEVEIKLRKDSPIRIDYSNEEMQVRYYLAPKISDNDD
jgi:proliferating cell nuclear antigen